MQKSPQGCFYDMTNVDMLYILQVFENQSFQVKFSIVTFHDFTKGNIYNDIK